MKEILEEIQAKKQAMRVVSELAAQEKEKQIAAAVITQQAKEAIEQPVIEVVEEPVAQAKQLKPKGQLQKQFEYEEYEEDEQVVVQFEFDIAHAFNRATAYASELLGLAQDQ